MKTIIDLFIVAESFKRLDYAGLVELFHFLDEESVAAYQLLDDAHIYSLFDDEFEELGKYITKCNRIKNSVYSYSLKNYWEHREVDFVAKYSALSGEYTKEEINKMKEEAKKRDEIANKPPVLVFVEELKKDLIPEEDIEEFFDIEELLAF